MVKLLELYILSRCYGVPSPKSTSSNLGGGAWVRLGDEVE